MMMTDLMIQIEQEMLQHKAASAFIKETKVRTRTNKEIMTIAVSQMADDRSAEAKLELEALIVHSEHMRNKGDGKEMGNLSFDFIGNALNLTRSQAESAYKSGMKKIMTAMNDDDHYAVTMRELLEESEQIVLDEYFYTN